MITILHGEDTVKSRRALDSLKTKGGKCEVLVLDGNKLTLTDLLQALESRSLFGQEKMVILENFLSARKKSKEQESIIAYLKDRGQEADLILWEGQEISRLILRYFSRAKIQIFKLDPHLFQFLAAIKPGNQQKMLTSFRQALTQEDINLVFHMLVRQFRFLLFLKDSKSGLEEIDRLADWQKAKILQQSQVFTTDELLKIYRQLLMIDYREKTGLAAMPLPKTLELFLAKL